MTDPFSEQPPVALRLGDVVKRSEPGRDRRGVVIATVVLAIDPETGLQMWQPLPGHGDLDSAWEKYPARRDDGSWTFPAYKIKSGGVYTTASGEAHLWESVERRLWTPTEAITSLVYSWEDWWEPEPGEPRR